MAKQNFTLIFSILVSAFSTWSWAAPPGGNKDVNPPATITTAVALPRIFAIGVDFSSVGDDGLSGAATSYDVFVRPASGSCAAPSADLSGWTRSERSDLVIPRSSGFIESIPVRPLQPGTNYCIALRARDDAGLASPGWAVLTTATLPGPWTLSEATVPLTIATPTWINRLRVTTDNDMQAQLGWIESSGIFGSDIQGVGFATAATVGEGAIQMGRTYFPVRTYVDTFLESYAARPPTSASGDMSLLIFGTAPSTARKQAVMNRLLLVERQSGVVTPTVVATGANQSGGGIGDDYRNVSLAYLPDGRPAVTLERVITRSNSQLDTALVFLERSGSDWNETELLRRTTQLTSGNSVNHFGAVNLVGMSNGDTNILASGCGRTVMMRRDAITSVWHYYDAGPFPEFIHNFVAAEGQSGDLLAIRGNGTTVKFARLNVGVANVSLKALTRKPSSSCNIGWSDPTNAALAWEPVNLADGSMDYVTARAIGEPLGGKVQLLYYLASSTPTGTTADRSGFEHEGRLAARCGAGSWSVEKLDRGIRTGWDGVLDAGGNALYSSAWGRGNTARLRNPANDKVYFGVRSGSPDPDCGSAPQP